MYEKSVLTMVIFSTYWFSFVKTDGKTDDDDDDGDDDDDDDDDEYFFNISNCALFALWIMWVDVTTTCVQQLIIDKENEWKLY